MKKGVIKQKKFNLHECKKELFLLAHSMKSVADSLEQDAISYDVKFPKYYVLEIRNRANSILERL